MMTKEFEVKIISAVAPDLALRDIASSFFDGIESRPEEKIVVDFSGVETISRAFAHEYQVRKGQSMKTVTEVNVLENVSKMFAAAMDCRKEPHFPGLKNISFTRI